MRIDIYCTLACRFRFARNISAITILVFVLLLSAPYRAQAQDDGVVRTVFCIANVDGSFMNTFPISAFSVNGNQLISADTFTLQHQGVGAVGLAVDSIAEHLYVTYEGENFIDAFDARDGTLLTHIYLPGADNLAGIDIRIGDGLLYVVNRGQDTLWVYDSDTFDPVENWTLTDIGGAGAFDLEVVEDWNDRDVIFVSNGNPDVHYYDLDTQEHLGEYVMSNAASSMTVDNHRGTPVLFAAATPNGTPGGHSFLLKYDVATGQQDQVGLGGGDGRGVGVNPGENLVYLNVGASMSGTIRVYDQDTLAELNRYPVAPGLFTSPSDLDTASIPIGSFVRKQIISTSANTNNGPGEFEEGEAVVFQITAVNKRAEDIHVLPIADIYDTQVLTFVSSTIAPSDSANDGEIEFDNLITLIGHDLAFEEEFSFEITFRAEPANCVDPVGSTNAVVMSGAVDVGGRGISDQTDEVDITIRCGCWRNEDCDDGLFCNGQEGCFQRQCSPGADPCPDDTICDEATDSCDPITDDDVNDDVDDDANDDVDNDEDDDYTNDDAGNDDSDDDAGEDNDESGDDDETDDTGGSCCG